MREKWVRSLGGEDPLEEGMGTQSSILLGKSHEQRRLAGCSPRGRQVGHGPATKHNAEHKPSEGTSSTVARRSLPSGRHSRLGVAGAQTIHLPPGNCRKPGPSPQDPSLSPDWEVGIQRVLASDGEALSHPVRPLEKSFRTCQRLLNPRAQRAAQRPPDPFLAGEKWGFGARLGLS